MKKLKRLKQVPFLLFIIGILIGCLPDNELTGTTMPTPTLEEITIDEVPAGDPEEESFYEYLCGSWLGNIETSGYYEWSADGKYILISYDYSRGITPNYYSDYLVVDIERAVNKGDNVIISGTLPHLANETLSKTSPSISSSGQKVAYMPFVDVPNYEKLDSIAVNDLIDGTTKIVYKTSIPGFFNKIKWSPNDNYLAFTYYESGVDLRSLKVTSASDGTQSYQLDNVTEFSWSPDGKSISGLRSYKNGYRRDNPLFIANIGTGSIREIDLGRCISSGAGPQWSPDGKWLAINNSDDALVIENPKNDYDIFVIDVETLALKNMTNQPSTDAQPSWSPDGQQIAFTSADYNPESYFDELEKQEICLVNMTGDDLGCITDTPDLAENTPQWSPTGEWIAFITTEIIPTDIGLQRQSHHLTIMHPDGSERLRLFTWP